MVSVNFLGPVGPTGYGRITTFLCPALEKAGVKINVIPAYSGELAGADKKIVDMVKNLDEHVLDADVAVLLVSNGCHRTDTGSDGHAIRQHRTSTALRLSTTVFRACQLEVLTQHFEQRPVGLGCDTPRLAVYSELDGFFHKQRRGFDRASSQHAQSEWMSRKSCYQSQRNWTLVN